MKNRTDWKTAAKYVCGMLGIAVSVAAAMLFPEWYCQWQDQKIMEDVTLTRRETIEFLDTESLDIAGRMQLLAQTEQLMWLEYADTPFGTEMEIEKQMERCRTAVKHWADCGILPQGCEELLTEENREYGCNTYIYADQSAFRAFVLRFYGPDNSALTCVIDAEMDMIYYFSYTSTEMRDDIGLMLGYDSFDDFIICLEKGDFPRGTQEDYSGYDFAAACGADDADIQGESGYLELTVELQYDNFTANAYRTFVENDMGAGIAYMLGTRQWENVLMEILDTAGYWESSLDLKSIAEEMRAANEASDRDVTYSYSDSLAQEIAIY